MYVTRFLYCRSHVSRSKWSYDAALIPLSTLFISLNPLSPLLNILSSLTHVANLKQNIYTHVYEYPKYLKYWLCPCFCITELMCEKEMFRNCKRDACLFYEQNINVQWVVYNLNHPKHIPTTNKMDLLFTVVFFLFLIETRQGTKSSEIIFSSKKKTKQTDKKRCLFIQCFDAKWKTCKSNVEKMTCEKANFIWVDYVLFRVWYCHTIFKLNDFIGCDLKTRARNHLTKIISVHFRRKKIKFLCFLLKQYLTCIKWMFENYKHQHKYRFRNSTLIDKISFEAGIFVPIVLYPEYFPNSKIEIMIWNKKKL